MLSQVRDRSLTKVFEPAAVIEVIKEYKWQLATGCTVKKSGELHQTHGKPLGCRTILLAFMMEVMKIPQLAFCGLLLGSILLQCQPSATSQNETHMSQQQNELDQLFQVLKTTQSSTEIELIQADIWQVWLQSGEPTTDQLMARGITAMSDEDYDASIDYFTQIIEAQPDYAEGWNKRATAYFMRGNYKASIDDIEQTLAREERHFGALSGLVSIYRTVGDDRAALRTVEKLAAIMPADEQTQKLLQQLRDKLGIRNI